MTMILAQGLFACAPAQPAADTTTEDLMIAVPRGTTATAAAAYAAWFEQQTGTRVRIERLTTDQYDDQVGAALLSGSDRYDLVYLSAENLGRWAAYHALQPITGLQNTKSLAPWLGIITQNGQIYGVPVQPDAMVLWYRADLLQSANLRPPADWKAFQSAARALNQPPDHYGAVIAGSDVDSAYSFAAVLAGFGGQAVNDTHQGTINEPAARSALELYASLHTIDRVTPPGVENFSAFEVLAALQSGKAALGIAPLSAGSSLLDYKTSPKVCTQDRKPLMAFTRLPGLPETTGAGSLGAWAIPLHARQQAPAQAFAARLATLEGAKAWAGGGGVPASRDALADPQVQAQIRGAGLLSRIDHYQLAVPPLSTTEQVLKAYHQAVHAAVAGTQTPDQALNQAAEEINKALRQGGY